MKKAYFIFLSLLSIISYGQEAKQDTLYVATQSYGDSVVVRWAPGSTHLWKVANKVGYYVERKKN
ncbi:hypothetical protein [Fulvivirga ligni]|uniref:hypothetical protein n=1 Tax=Fulvivirga ligni TaxID=2904246 RepID=UPI001F48FB9F|nr:hypothetical protein [Fulvivirga ligni]UII23989.1 hypothetical protein LVD16_12245 [Fulvivirga ligni]